MLFFISLESLIATITVEFKYISCYSLSPPGILLQELYSLFKYISCYSLSEIQRYNIDQAYEFKYISCYSLSSVFKPFFNCNTSPTPLSFRFSAIFYHPRSVISIFTLKIIIAIVFTGFLRYSYFSHLVKL